MNFSAKKLLSQSAMKLCYDLHHQGQTDSFRHSEWIEKGQLFQEEVLRSFNSVGDFETEMSGCFTTSNGDNIYFSHDIVETNGLAIYETKVDIVGIDEAYLRKSLLQCAVYDTLTRFSSPMLYKAKFARSSQADCKPIQLRKNYKYYLKIGRNMYNVELSNPYPIIQFLEEKIDAIKSGYETAKRFDNRWKHSYLHKLSECFIVHNLH